MSRTNAGWVGVVLLTLASGTQASVEAGRIQFAIGDARALAADGAPRALKKGDAVHEGETIVTGAGGSTQLRMADKAVIAVRPNSRLQIDTYRFQGREDGSEHAVLRLVKGGFRTITGLIGRANKDNYKILTDTANIGIRGTDHEPAYVPSATAGEASDAAPGTYDKVNTGGTFLATPAGRVDLFPNQVGFASVQPGATPVRLDSVPGFMRSTPAIQDGRTLRDENQPNRVAAPESDNPDAYGDQPGIAHQALAYGQIPDVVTRKTTADGSVDLTGTGNGNGNGTFAGGTDRVSGVYGDISAGAATNGAFTAVREPAESFLTGMSGALAATDPNSKLIYTRGATKMQENGSASFEDNGTTVFVNWGVYGDGKVVPSHMIKDKNSDRNPLYAQFMAAQETPAAILSNLSGSYSGIIASTPIIAESGVPGGSVTKADITLTNGALTNYAIDVTDGLTRNWSAGYSGSVALATFRDSGVALSGSGPTGAASGRANGHPVGPNGLGVISSFALTDASCAPACAISGSFAVVGK